MSAFLEAIPSAASSPYAFAAYALAAILMTFGGFKILQLRAVMKGLKSRPEIPPDEVRRLVEVATNTKLPDSITAEQWLKNNRFQGYLFVTAAVVIAVAAIIIIAILNRPTDLKAVLNEQDRAIHPLGAIRVGFTLKLPRTAKGLSSALKQIDEEADAFRKQLQINMDNPIFKDNHGMHTRDEGALLRENVENATFLEAKQKSSLFLFTQYPIGGGHFPVLAVSSSSRAFPTDDGSLGTTLITEVGLSLSFFRTRPKSFEHPEIPAADLSFIVMDSKSNDSGGFDVMVNLINSDVYQMAVDRNAVFRHENGNLVSTVDLAGAILVVEGTNGHTHEGIELDSMFLRFNDAYTHAINHGQFVKHARTTGPPVFVYQFPPSNPFRPQLGTK